MKERLGLTFQAVLIVFQLAVIIALVLQNI